MHTHANAVTHTKRHTHALGLTNTCTYANVRTHMRAQGTHMHAQTTHVCSHGMRMRRTRTHLDDNGQTRFDQHDVSGGLGGVFGVASLAVILLFGGLAVLAIDVALLFWTLVAVGILLLIVLGVLSSTLGGIYKAAVYRYAAQQQVAPQFDAALIQGAFRAKGAAA